MAKSYEKQIEELKEIITKIENGDAGLDESLSLYEKGITILQNCQKILEEAEMKVSELSD
ncbi:exodeoxyribonuclease VII small subunit [Methanomicrobium antiquum]|uniref:Exodeoxyribonuclease VII small subunit n=1 Tax=Methanomicrobium antiquum TaxID=487686 RepID=A0AAF0FQ14_9EURY|nr:exodeoxyribonuclease VII small subunit [Methanomicrobium antiquum]MDD3977890.1 exodeoxyribonuclease VII small subunit [Methanomicrobium sp.]WFN37575.1 exodeoxyribonuclease VII small subunit [Methanomicrobium antiquum]